MKNFGLFLFVYGIAAIVFKYTNYHHRLLIWMDNWGDAVAWAIKVALIVLGAVIYFSSRRAEQKSN